MDYKEQLKDVRWKLKRLQILKRDRFKCQMCGYEKGLMVHHTYYKSGKKAWQYPNKSLITLCGQCHYKVHYSDLKQKPLHISGVIKKMLKSV